MIKKIPKTHLRLGMFIHDLNVGWMAHDFLRSRFMLKREADLQKILESGLDEVYIDTFRGLDLPGAPTQEEAQGALFQEMVAQTTMEGPLPLQREYREEVHAARTVHREANRAVETVLQEVRLGRRLRVEEAQPIAQRITESVLRNRGVLVSMCRMKERDAYTFQHSVSVSALLSLFAHGMGFSEDRVLEAGLGGLLHDTGKMTIPDEILNKPDKLTDEEYEVMKGHVSAGSKILQSTSHIPEAAWRIAAEHHERFEGTGYPVSLRGHGISELGRMAAIADVYDALTSDRVYHRGHQPSEALAKMFEWSRQHFDQRLMQHFIRFIGIYPVGTLVRLDSARLGVVLDQRSGSLLTPVVRTFYDTLKEAFVPPMDIDLSAPESGGDHILGWEDPLEWGVEPLAMLPT